MVGLEEKKNHQMNKDFTQSVLAGFAICSCNENVIKPGFYCDLPHASHEIKGLLERRRVRIPLRGNENTRDYYIRCFCGLVLIIFGRLRGKEKVT